MPAVGPDDRASPGAPPGHGARPPASCSPPLEHGGRLVRLGAERIEPRPPAPEPTARRWYRESARIARCALRRQALDTTGGSVQACRWGGAAAARAHPPRRRLRAGQVDVHDNGADARRDQPEPAVVGKHRGQRGARRLRKARAWRRCTVRSDHRRRATRRAHRSPAGARARAAGRSTVRASHRRARCARRRRAPDPADPRPGARTRRTAGAGPRRAAVLRPARKRSPPHSQPA